MRETLILILCLCWNCAAESVVRLRYERMEGAVKVTGHGTAFSIAKGQLLTCAHNVLDENDKPWQTLHIECNGEWRKAKVVRYDKVLDLCILKSDADLEPLKFADSDARKGEVITLIGSCKGEPISKHNGVVERIFYDGSIRTRMKVFFNHGFSGGVVVIDGKAAGIAVAGLPLEGDIDTTICLFVPLFVIREFLKGE